MLVAFPPCGKNEKMKIRNLRVGGMGKVRGRGVGGVVGRKWGENVGKN
jgi:hypothetical protein